jgi:hypothetical protein
MRHIFVTVCSTTRPCRKDRLGQSNEEINSRNWQLYNYLRHEIYTVFVVITDCMCLHVVSIYFDIWVYCGIL